MPPGPDPAAKPGWRRVLARVAPYAIATVAVVVILGKYPPSQIAEEMTRGRCSPWSPTRSCCWSPGSMPVNVAGIGAVQGAWLLLVPWAQGGEQILAFAVLWQRVVGAGMVLRGLPFVRQVASEIERGPGRDDRAPEAEPSAS